MGVILKGALAAMASVAKLPYDDALDGISYTFSITPNGLGPTMKAASGISSLCLDGYFLRGGTPYQCQCF